MSVSEAAEPLLGDDANLGRVEVYLYIHIFIQKILSIFIYIYLYLSNVCRIIKNMN